MQCAKRYFGGELMLGVLGDTRGIALFGHLFGDLYFLR